MIASDSQNIIVKFWHSFCDFPKTIVTHSLVSDERSNDIEPNEPLGTGRLVRQLRGTSLRKQYVNFIGTRSVLEQTWDRAERLIPGRKILTTVTEHHLLAPRHAISWRIERRAR